LKNEILPSKRSATATPPAPSGGTIDCTCRATMRSASLSAPAAAPQSRSVSDAAVTNRMIVPPRAPPRTSPQEHAGLLAAIQVIRQPYEIRSSCHGLRA
jgi:hypothetical protein